MNARLCYIVPSILLLTVIGCERRDPLAPSTIQASSSSSGAAPNAPSMANATAASVERIDVSWQDNATNETGFEIRRSTTGPDGSFPVIATSGANATSYSDTGLSHGTQYCYKIRAFSVGRKTTSYSTLTAPACATTPAPPVPPGPPDAPSNAAAFGVASQQIVVSWTDNSNNEDGFRLERATDNRASWVVANTTLANTYSAGDAPVASEVQACYRVVAINGAGDSPPSNTACATTVAGPTDLTVDSLGSLHWTDNSVIEDGYEVWVMDAFGPAYDGLIATLPANTTDLQTYGCGGSCHGFAVIAFKDGSYSDWAAVWVVNTIPDTP